SERSAGQSYQTAARWRLKTPIPGAVATIKISAATPEGAPRLIFSALDTAFAAELEPKFASAGHAVVSNSSALRMQSDVPLVIPEVNADHVRLLECQSWRRDSNGFVVTNPNCSATGLVMALAPLHHQFGVEQVFVVTMQAISGAGYPGVASLDILGNVIPYIAKEEEKMESESCKMLGKLDSTGIIPASIHVSAHCNRVPVEDGHTESVSIKLKKPAKHEEILKALAEFRGVPQELRLPNAPPNPIVVLESPDRPQPTLDVNMGAGMAVTVGRVRPCRLLDWKFTVLSHNTIRGAAGAALLNAELLKAQGYL
ncbi:MAG TPA: aspartate-semialdehyde dehydrogenase, partial [Terriglobales bacterium]|nr:aspartate-semialdehyde dehydrogenase [Terriglobales bacterium]